ncbi:MAG: hypothetical protein HN368_17850, partial [Spirochaetales bacterium]|nr:hypothetical protein [Spirochaetales bacterium]
MERKQLTVQETPDSVIAANPRQKIEISKLHGKISRICLYDGIKWNELMPTSRFAGDSWELPVKAFKVVSKDPQCLQIEITRADDFWRF